MIPVARLTSAEEVLSHAMTVARRMRGYAVKTPVVTLKPINPVATKPDPEPIAKPAPPPIQMNSQFNMLIAWRNFSGNPAIKDYARPAEIPIRFIAQCAAVYFEVDHADLVSRRRFKGILPARAMMMWGCRKLTSHALPKIGYHLGRDHTTIIHANQSVDRRCAADPIYAEFAFGFLTFVNHQWRSQS
jgi:hypothetical protein